MFVSLGVSGQIHNSPPKPGRKPYMKRCVLKKKYKSVIAFEYLINNFLNNGPFC